MTISKLLNIEHLLDRVPYQLSVGEKRKVAVATVFAIDPDVLILDEPTAGLDPLTVRIIIDLIVQANKQGKTVITSTHDLHTAGEIADTVYVFSKDKRIVRFGPTAQGYSATSHFFKPIILSTSTGIYTMMVARMPTHTCL